MPQKVVISTCFGGFSLSRAAFLELRKRGHQMALDEPDIGEKWPGDDGYGGDYVRSKSDTDFLRDIGRTDPVMIEVLEEIGLAISSGSHAQLKIVEIPDGVQWHVEDYDGRERVAENHRSWA